jgi:hypothetical protein
VLHVVAPSGRGWKCALQIGARRSPYFFAGHKFVAAVFTRQ